jgi:hypothetical protein
MWVNNIGTNQSTCAELTRFSNGLLRLFIKLNENMGDLAHF